MRNCGSRRWRCSRRWVADGVKRRLGVWRARHRLLEPTDHDDVVIVRCLQGRTTGSTMGRPLIRCSEAMAWRCRSTAETRPSDADIRGLVLAESAVAASVSSAVGRWLRSSRNRADPRDEASSRISCCSTRLLGTAAAEVIRSPPALYRNDCVRRWLFQSASVAGKPRPQVSKRGGTPPGTAPARR